MLLSAINKGVINVQTQALFPYSFFKKFIGFLINVVINMIIMEMMAARVIEQLLLVRLFILYLISSSHVYEVKYYYEIHCKLGEHSNGLVTKIRIYNLQHTCIEI